MSRPRITPIVMPQEVETVYENSLGAEERVRARSAASAIMGCGFTWSTSAEGTLFWRSVYDRLMAISEGEPLK